MKWFEIRMVVVSVMGLCLLLAVNVPTAQADFTFGEPVNLGPPINTGHHELAPFFSADGLELVFSRWEAGGSRDIHVTRRATVDSEWDVPVKLGPPVNSSDHEHSPSISADGLTLYFVRGVHPTGRLYMAKRATTNDDWDRPVLADSVVNTHTVGPLSVSTDDLELYFAGDRPGGYGGFDLWLARRATVNDEWGTPINLGPTINSGSSDSHPAISPDRLLLFFSSNRPGGFGPDFDIYVTRRATRDDPWDPPMNLGPVVNGAFGWVGLQVSFDGSMLYFHSGRPGGLGGWDIYQAPILPIVDFNGDGVVDLVDLVMLIENWGTDNPLYDIGPYPWGDGKVDIEDLKVFIAEWEKQNLPAEP